MPTRFPGSSGLQMNDSCPDPIVLSQFSAGRLDAKEAARVMQHIAGCAGCGADLKMIAGDLEVEASPEESRMIESLATAAPEGRRRLALQMAAGSRRAWQRPLAMAAGIAVAALALSIGWQAWQRRENFPPQLIARAYSANRPFSYRLQDDGKPGAVKIPRSGTDVTSLPPNLVSTIATLEQFLATKPDDPELLNALGQARLMAWDLDGAAQVLERARGLRPSDNGIAISVAVLDALRSDRVQTSGAENPLTLQALALLNGCLERRPTDVVARFNRALIFKQLGRTAEASADLQRCLTDEPDTAWAGEIRSLLATLQPAR